MTCIIDLQACTCINACPLFVESKVAKYTLVKSTDMNAEMKEEVEGKGSMHTIERVAIEEADKHLPMHCYDGDDTTFVAVCLPMSAGHGHLHHCGREVPS